VKLPSELQRQIFSALEIKDLSQTSATSKEWQKLSDDSGYWNQFLKLEYKSENDQESKKTFLNKAEARLDKYLLFDKKGEKYLKQFVEDPESLKFLMNEWGKLALENEFITIDLFFNLPEEEFATFDVIFNEFGWRALKNNLFSMNEFLTIPAEERTYLNRIFNQYGILALEENLITMQQFFAVPPEERCTLQYVLFTPNGYSAFKKGLITIEQFLLYPERQRSSLAVCLLDKEGGIELLEKGIITLESFFGVPMYDRDALVDQLLQNRINLPRI